MASTKQQKRDKRANKGKIDITFLSFVLILLTIGLVMLFSASYAYSLEYYGNSYMFITRQSCFQGLTIMFGEDLLGLFLSALLWFWEFCL